MIIDDLMEIMPPPQAPVEASGISWLAIEENAATELPQDYKSFIETYGSGCVAAFLYIFNPVSSRETINLLKQIPRQLWALEVLAEQFGERHPCPLFPPLGGLLPFGITDNGDVLHWLTSGKPVDWQVVVNESRGPRYELYSSDMTTFLLRLLTRSLRCPIFPDDFPPTRISFEVV
jgi:SMI1-KNR4 cell-wall